MIHDSHNKEKFCLLTIPIFLFKYIPFKNTERLAKFLTHPKMELWQGSDRQPRNSEDGCIAYWASAKSGADVTPTSPLLLVVYLQSLIDETIVKKLTFSAIDTVLDSDLSDTRWLETIFQRDDILSITLQIIWKFPKESV